MYRALKPYLFRQDPEAIHDRVMGALAFASGRRPLLSLVGALCRPADPRLAVEAFGLRFPNPVGLAAGFDKNAVAVPAWQALGFGFVEVGSVTALAQPGNPKPRLFRLPEDEALINRFGFNNDGAEAVAARIARMRAWNGPLGVPLGVNLGKSKLAGLDEAAGDYLASLKALWPHGDYFALNVSSPNTPGLRQLQDRERLDELLAAVAGYARAQAAPKPLLLKIAPDLTLGQIDEILELVERHGVSGVIATNTTLGRGGLKTPTEEAGGLSGRPLRARSLEVLRHLAAQTGGRLPLVSVGGVFGADDVWERLEAGASLVQVYTGLVYEGPLMLRRMGAGLARRMAERGIPSLAALRD